MDCVNHPGVERTAFCQNCGKALCAACVRREPGGQILCEPCWTTWQAVRAPFVPAAPGAPNPGIAAVLGLIPGVGAMYNGQFFKGLLHVVIFAVLISMTQYYGIFGLFIAAWVFYQAFEAYHVAKARRDGDPLPDPLGLNEVGNWLHLGFQPDLRQPQGPPPPPAGAGPFAGGPGQAPLASGFTPFQGSYQAPHSNPYQSGYQPPPYSPPAAPYTPYTPPASGFYPGYPPPPPASGFAAGSPPMPPMPPVPPMHWKRREPIAAIILIAMGVLFLLGQFSGRVMAFAWPVLLIALGAWLIIRRMQESQPSPMGANGGAHAAAPAEEDKSDKRRDGGIL